MSLDTTRVWSRSSTSSSRSRLGKSVSERIRELGISVRRENITSKTSVQYISIKTEYHRPSDVIIMRPAINFGQIIYYQPEIVLDRSFPEKRMYKIEKFMTASPGPKDSRRISDIEVKSFKPLKKMVFRKKKRHSSFIEKIEQLLNRGNGSFPFRDPSEESLQWEYRNAYENEKVISDLPENIMQKIFLLFDLKERNLLLAKVCKSWYYMLKDPIFWTELTFSGTKVSTQIIIDLIKKYTCMKKLTLNAVPNGVEILQELCRCNHNITHLTVKHCPISGPDFARIICHFVACCRDLEVLNIKGMRFQSDKLYLELGRLRKLRSVNLTGNRLLKNQDLITLSLNCRAIQELRIYDVNSENKQKSCLRNEDVALIVSHLQPNLRTLKMDMKLLKSMAYQAIIKCSELRCLGLKNCFYLSSEVFQQFVDLKQLRKLKITRAINLKPEDFHFVFSSDSMNKIEDLDINGCWGVGEFGLQALTHGHKPLKSLSLKNCKSIKGYHLVHLTSCPNLTYLNLAHTEVEAEHLLYLSPKNKKLQSLVIDKKMLKKSTIQQLKRQFPFLTVMVSCSEYQTQELPLSNI